MSDKYSEAAGTFPRIDRIIWLIFFIVAALPIMFPIGLPLDITEVTRDYYATIEDIPEAGVVLYSFDSGMGAFAEMGPADIGTITHLTRVIKSNGIKVIFATTAGPEGQVALNVILTQYVDMSGLVYGEDYLNLGLIPGYESTLAALAEDLHKIAPTDVEGTRLTDIPWIANVRGAENYDIFIFSTATSPDPYPRQWAQYDKPILAVVQAATASWIRPYHEAGMITAYLPGQRGGAEYEVLLGAPGLGCSYMDAQSLTHVYAIVLILVVNIQWYLKRKGDET